jgi:hydrogenase nickel incorporation protein HypA/HybF
VHEYSLVGSLLERVVAEAAAHEATGVRKIRLLVGEHAGVEVDLLRWAFGVLKENTPCAEAELEVVSVAARWECSQCSCEVPAGESTLVCPRCEAPAALVAGMELVLERIELRVPD